MDTSQLPRQGREPFLNNFVEKVGSTGHRPHIYRVISGYDGRTMSIPGYSLVTELLSLLQDPLVRSTYNLTPGYYVLMGKSAAGGF